MFATRSIEDARKQLNRSIARRLAEDWSREHGFSLEPMRWPFERIRFPVGLFFIRGDRAGQGDDLARQVVASFGYWNDDSGRFFDMVFAGWGKDGDAIVFDRTAFLRFRDQVEQRSKWQYSGETDVLVLNYDYVIAERSGDFAFDKAMYLPVEAMVRGGRVGSLDALMHELIHHARTVQPSSDRSVVWEMSDRIGIDRGRRALWDVIRARFLNDVNKVYDELRPFAVCDLRPRRGAS